MVRSSRSTSAADELILAMLDDPDAGVQAAAVRQLRARRVPDALQRLVALLDSRLPEVREAARTIEELCHLHEKDISATAIRFCLDHPYVSSTLVGMATQQEVIANLELLKMRTDVHFLTELRAAIAPALTNGFPVCVGISTTATTELNALPVGSDQMRSNTLSGPNSCMARPRVKTFEIDCRENA